jgi:hypothetical protein
MTLAEATILQVPDQLRDVDLEDGGEVVMRALVAAISHSTLESRRPTKKPLHCVTVF